MATKPTPRIPDWASGGDRTDPGAGKEATGWVPSERVPAEWWNWLLGAIGDWLSWSETSIDANETDIAALQAWESKALGHITVASGATTDSAGSFGFSSDVQSGAIEITFDTAFASTDYFLQVTAADNTGYYYTTSRVTPSVAWIHPYDGAGGTASPATYDQNLYLDAKGEQ